MRLMLTVLLASALLSSLGCGPDRPIPNRLVPHRLSRPVEVTIYVRTEKGDLQEAMVEVPAGWWLASPELIEAP